MARFRTAKTTATPPGLPRRDSSDTRRLPPAGTAAHRDPRPRAECADASAGRANQLSRRPWKVRYDSTVIQHSAATLYLTVSGSQRAEDQKASIAAAMTSITTQP